MLIIQHRPAFDAAANGSLMRGANCTRGVLNSVVFKKQP